MSGSLSRCRVLIVDDDKDNAESLFRLVQAMGCDAEFLIDPLQALAAVERRKPSIVFLDLGMPKMDGYELAHQIRTRYPHDDIALVALTGYTSSDSRARSRGAGFDAHLAKPASPALIESTLRQFDVGKRK